MGNTPRKADLLPERRRKGGQDLSLRIRELTVLEPEVVHIPPHLPLEIPGDVPPAHVMDELAQLPA